MSLKVKRIVFEMEGTDATMELVGPDAQRWLDRHDEAMAEAVLAGKMKPEVPNFQANLYYALRMPLDHSDLNRLLEDIIHQA